MSHSLYPFPQGIFYSLVLLFFCNFLGAQEFLGIGVHFAPPIRIDNCCNSYVEAKPILVPAYSFSFRKLWENKKEKGWYYEVGLTTMGIGVKVQKYPTDTTDFWNEFNMTHAGFPSLLFGGGRVFPLKGKLLTHNLSFGLEGSYRTAHELDQMASKNFGLARSKKDITFPVFLRLSTAYGLHFNFLRNIPFYFQVYTNVSFQDIARSPQYLRDPITGLINKEGKYKLNNSEIGLKLFASTDINYNKHKWVKREKTPKAERDKPFVFRVSIEGQTYFPPATKYYTPKVDSFSLTGFKYAFTHQAGIKTEILHPRNSHWATVLGVGFGTTYVTTHFKAIPAFTRTGSELDMPPLGDGISVHIIPNLGFAYKHSIGKKYIQHSISATLVIPIEKESSKTNVYDVIDPTDPPHLWQSILEAEFDYKYGRANTLFGLEYQPELLVHTDERFFYGIGLVFNYSWGVIAQGRVTVDNGRTQYYGGIIQNFSKIGVTLRMGWNSSRRL